MRIGILNNIKNNNYIDYDLNFTNSIAELKSNYLTVYSVSGGDLANMPSAKVGTIVYLRPKTNPIDGTLVGGLITVKGSNNISITRDTPLTYCICLRCLGPAGNAWEVINKVGSQGLQGYQGEQGIQGAQGAQGAEGIQGIQGKDSDIGSQGPPGLDGAQGIGGDQGPVGDPGDPGLPGAPGAQGG